MLSLLISLAHPKIALPDKSGFEISKSFMNTMSVRFMDV